MVSHAGPLLRLAKEPQTLNAVLPRRDGPKHLHLQVLVAEKHEEPLVSERVGLGLLDLDKSAEVVGVAVGHDDALDVPGSSSLVFR